MNKKKLYSKILFPIICIIVGLLLGGYITYQYAEECNNIKWPFTQATVVDMNSYESSSVNHSNRTIYVISYEYIVENISYKGEIRSYYPNQVGNRIEIKYNPDNPADSTAVIVPDTERFIIVLIFSVILIVSGIFFTIVIWKNRFSLSVVSEDKPYYHGPKERINPKSYLKLLIPIGFFLSAFVLMYYQPFAQKNINVNEFVQIMETDGYTAENSLERLQTEFGMGSIIEQAYSVNTENIRIDYCTLNTSNNAKLLYDSASLPANTYVISDKYFLAAEDNNFFYIKSFKNNTFVYGACKIESKDELLRLLKDMSYYDK